MSLLLLACAADPNPGDDRMDLDGACDPTPDWAGGFFGYPEFTAGGDIEGDGELHLDLASVGGVVTGTMLLSGDIVLQGAAIPQGKGWEFEIDGSSCWDDGAHADFTIRLASAVVDAPAGWMEGTVDEGSLDAWFPDGDAYEYVFVMQGPATDPFFSRLK